MVLFICRGSLAGTDEVRCHSCLGLTDEEKNFIEVKVDGRQWTQLVISNKPCGHPFHKERSARMQLDVCGQVEAWLNANEDARH